MKRPSTMSLPALICLGLAGCGSYPSVRELDRIASLAHTPALPKLPREVSDTRDDEVPRLLAQPLDAEAAVRIALYNNRELRASLRELGIARGRLIQAGVLPNPIVEAEVLPERNTTLELRVEWDVTSVILAPIRARAASADLDAERQRSAALVVELGYRTRAAYYALVAAERRLAIGREVLKTDEASRDTARALSAAGNLRALDVRTQEAGYERSSVVVASLELEVADRREALQRLLGLQGRQLAWTTKGELPELPHQLSLAEDLEGSALRASLELGELRTRLEGAARRVGLVRAQGWLPDVAVDFHSLYGHQEVTPGTALGALWRYGGGVRVGVPLFDHKQGMVAAQKAELDALAERGAGASVDIRSAAREARNRLVSAHARARKYEEAIVPAQQRVLDETLLQYNAMQLGVFQLLQARRELLDVQLASVDTQREFWTARAAMDALLAGRRIERKEANTPRFDGPASGGH